MCNMIRTLINKIKKYWVPATVALTIVNIVSRKVPHPVAATVVAATSALLIIPTFVELWQVVANPELFYINLSEPVIKGIAEIQVQLDDSVSLEDTISEIKQDIPEIMESLKPIFVGLRVFLTIVLVLELKFLMPF